MPITIFNIASSNPDLLDNQSLAQELIYYTESRFRSALISYNQANPEKRSWMKKLFLLELVRGN